MTLALKINGTDRSSYINWPTLQKTEVLTKEVDRLEFEILKTPAKTTLPDVGDAVSLEENGTSIFGGVIVEKNEVMKGGCFLATKCAAKIIPNISTARW
jgi:hypothetical protein